MPFDSNATLGLSTKNIASTLTTNAAMVEQNWPPWLLGKTLAASGRSLQFIVFQAYSGFQRLLFRAFQRCSAVVMP